MLRPLQEALGKWTPEKDVPSTADPLALLATGWREIVGDDVARNSHPARILDHTLWVTTRSSAWSQQLSFLSEPILAAVRARLPQTSVTSLRFRIGKLPARIAHRMPAHTELPPRPTKRAVLPAAADAAEALRRFRGAVEERRRANRRAGWKECRDCGASVASRDALCVACQNAQTDRRAAAAARLMFEAPWLGYSGTAELVDGLTPAEYDATRNRLLSRWWEALTRAREAKRLSRDGRERTIASSYVVLKSKLPPEAIDPATLRNVLGDELNELLFGTER